VNLSNDKHTINLTGANMDTVACRNVCIIQLTRPSRADIRDDFPEPTGPHIPSNSP